MCWSISSVNAPPLHRSAKKLDALIKDSAENPEKYYIPVTFTSNKPGKREPARRWINRGWLRITKAYNAEIVPRKGLIDFTCDNAFLIIKTSKNHRELLDKYFR